LQELDAAAAAGGLLVIFGRPREDAAAHSPAMGLSQAIESAREIQRGQTYRDFQPGLRMAVVPRWEEFPQTLRLQKDGRWSV
jgi:hypothetical protein